MSGPVFAKETVSTHSHFNTFVVLPVSALVYQLLGYGLLKYLSSTVRSEAVVGKTTL